MTYEETIKIVGVLAMAYPSLQDRDLVAMAQVWHRLLGDLDYRLVDAAVQKHVATSKWPPTIAEIREAAASIRPDGEALPDPDEAWGEVLRAIQRRGWVNPPRSMWRADQPVFVTEPWDFSHPVIARTVQAMWGTWETACASVQQETLGVDRAQFIKLYQTMTKREREAALLPAPVREIAGQLAERLRTPALPGGDH